MHLEAHYFVKQHHLNLNNIRQLILPAIHSKLGVLLVNLNQKETGRLD
jgi:hypothetical protein